MSKVLLAVFALSCCATRPQRAVETRDRHLWALHFSSELRQIGGAGF